MVLLQRVAPCSEPRGERFGDFAARLGLGPGNSAPSALSGKGGTSLRELDNGESGFVRLPWLVLMRMEVILLFQLGEYFGFGVGLVGVGGKGGDLAI